MEVTLNKKKGQLRRAALGQPIVCSNFGDKVDVESFNLANEFSRHMRVPMLPSLLIRNYRPLVMSNNNTFNT